LVLARAFYSILSGKYESNRLLLLNTGAEYAPTNPAKLKHLGSMEIGKKV
jgi:hypothetical protein